MAVIELLSTYVGRADINEAIKAFNEIQAGNQKPELIIRAKNPVKDIDIAFLGYLALCKEACAELSIEWHLSYNEFIHQPPADKNSDEIKLGHKLVQTGVYSYLITRQIPYIIHFRNISINFDFTDGNQFKDGIWLILSSSFMPLVLISPKAHFSTFELFFEKKLSSIASISLQQGVPGVTWSPSSEELYRLYREELLDKADYMQHEKALIHLGIQSFYRALTDAKVLSFYTEPEWPDTPGLSKPSIRAGSLQSEARPYYEYIKGIFEELSDKPLIYHFIYSTLLASELLDNELELSTLPHFKTILLSLWHFSKDLAHGLCELAKNIDHSSSKTGIIAGRILKRDFWTDTRLYTDRSDFFKDYLSDLSKNGYTNKNNYFDIHVLDTGTNGIMPTLLDSSRGLLNNPALHSSIKSLIEEDVQHISNGDFGLADLLTPDKMIKLYQQCKRSIAHTGLLTFSKLIMSNNGVLKVNTTNMHGQKQTVIVPAISSPFENEPGYGTSFNVILPINTEIKYETHLPHSLYFPGELCSTEIKGIEEIFSFETVTGNPPSISLATDQRFILICTLPRLTITNREHEEILWQQFSSIIDDYSQKMPANSSYLVNADLEQVDLNASQLLRFLGQWEMERPKITLLLSNIQNETYHKLKQINEALTENNEALNFWNDQSPVIIYSYVTDERKARFYFTDVIMGKTKDDFLRHNKCVRRNHFNSTSLQFESNGQAPAPDREYPLARINSIAFFNGNILLPFDLLLKDSGKRILFEVNASMLLTKEIASFYEPANDRMIELIKKLHGYKVAGSHYRIGSKIHTNDFYYAKRVFQNNFFASRFAYLLAAEIIKSLSQEQVENIINDSLTLIGYGLYIEFLLNLLVKFLKKSSMLQGAIINHNLVNDDDSMSFIKPERLYKNIIVIVPIASTFSTAIKIEKNITDGKFENRIIQPHYNLLHISNGSEHDPLQPLERELGWMVKNADNKTIQLKAFFDEGEPIKTQKYLISLPSTWQKIEDCQDCFPVNVQKEECPINEKALFESDRKKVNPSFIFDYPRGRSMDENEATRTYKLNANMLKYGHLPANNSHMIYSINTEKFLEQNKEAVTKWLLKVKEDDDFKSSFTNTTHTLIVASCHPSNAAFIDLVNQQLFHSSANIIHYEPGNDHIQNFELIYGNEIEAAEKIIFVDDTIKSGDTFCRLYEFVNHIRSTTSPNNKGIEACVLLINKGTSFTNKTVTGKLTGKQRIYSFANLNIFSSLTLSQSSILTLEKERYEQMANDSLLNSLRRYFKIHIEKLQKSHSELTDEQKARRHKHLYFLVATHLVYQFFSNYRRSIDEFESFSHFADFLHHTVNCPIEMENRREASILGMNTIDVSILKTLTQYPFTQYAPLRKVVFRWLITLLDTHVNQVNEEIKNGRFTFTSFQGLKLLIRRANLLNASYLLSQKMLNTLAALYSDQGLPMVKKNIMPLQDAAQNQLKEIENFTIFFSAQIKELLVRNPLRSLKLEKQLNTIKNGTPGYEHIARILRGENTHAIQIFYETIKKGKGWLQLYQTAGTTVVEKSNVPLAYYLKMESDKTPQQLRFLEDFFKETGQDIKINIGFQNYLWVKHFLDIEQGLANLLLTDRSQYIFDKICDIFEKSKHSNIERVGLFLSISDSQRESYLVYDKNYKGVAELNSSAWHYLKEQYLGTFQAGDTPPASDYFKTVIELKKEPAIQKWIDLYAMEPGNPVKLDYNFLGENINRLVLLRLDKKSGEKLGMIGIYFTNNELDKLTDSNTIRYLLLLQRGLSDFVERHHLNNEFRDWLIAENTKRLAMLSGHGKEMLQEIARNNDVVRDIVIDLEHLQLIILLNENIKGSNGNPNTIEKFNQFYNISGQSRIDYAFLESLAAMAEGIFGERLIETVIACNAKVINTNSNFSFGFNQRILNLICYEVFLNAKKNRWHFFDDADNEEKLIPGYENNKITIQANIKKTLPRQMELLLTNTGPPVNKEILDKLKHRHSNVKANDITAGTSLIKMLTWEILNGEVYFDSKIINSNINNMHVFTVRLLLKEMEGI